MANQMIASYGDAMTALTAAYSTRMPSLPAEMQERIEPGYTMSALLSVWLATRDNSGIVSENDRGVYDFIRHQIRSADSPVDFTMESFAGVVDIELYSIQKIKPIFDIVFEYLDERYDGSSADLCIGYLKKYIRTIDVHQIDYIMRRADTWKVQEVMADKLVEDFRCTNVEYFRSRYFQPPESPRKSVFSDSAEVWNECVGALQRIAERRPIHKRHDAVYESIWEMARDCMPTASMRWLTDEQYRYRREHAVRLIGLALGDQCYKDFGQPPSLDIYDVETLKWHFRGPIAEVYDRIAGKLHPLSSDAAKALAIIRFATEPRYTNILAVLHEKIELKDIPFILKCFNLVRDDYAAMMPILRYIAEHCTLVRNTLAENHGLTTVDDIAGFLVVYSSANGIA